MRLQNISLFFHKNSQILEFFFLFFTSIIILFICLQITPGITPDSIIKYVPMSEFIFQRGFLEFLFKGSYESTVMPPLYEFFSAFFMKIGLDSIHSGGIVSNISFALFPIPLYYLAKQIGGMKCAVLSILLCCIMKPFWDSGTAIMTDMLFIFLVFSSISFFSRYVIFENISDLIFSSFFLVLANWTRWLGISLLLAYIAIFFLRYIQKRNIKKEIFYFSLISFPLISLLFIRNFLFVGEVYLIEKIPFSTFNIVINGVMAIITIIWDFVAYNPLQNFNQLLMNLYFTNYVNILPLDYLGFFDSFNYLSPQFISLLFGFFFIISFAIILLLRFYDSIHGFFKDFFINKQNSQLLLLFMLFYLGIFLYTEGTSRLSLIDSRYLIPIYPIIIIGFIQGIRLIIHSTPHHRNISTLIILLCTIVFIFWQSMATISYLSHVQSGRDFSDPQQMEGPAFQWMLQHTDSSSSFVINDGLRAYFWDKRLQNPLIKMPNRGHPIDAFLNNLTQGSYLVITPVIGTKGPYRMVELEHFLVNSSRYSLVLSKEQDRIFKVMNS